METKTTRNILLILLGFLGLGAIGGGGVLLVSPSGNLIGMPLSILNKSPFTSFLIPGILLFAVIGVAPCLLVVALLKKPECRFAKRLNFFTDMHWSWTFSIYVAFSLIIWIQAEMVFLQAVHWLHTVYMFLAMAILFVALLPKVRDLYKIK
ncbi:hypothetical protein [Spirosoma endbachense]|uniref:Uncharacterized protein n=1 Tax=Spirosoma endbachense TaxID=2666025 RepID=A0A6P1W1C2_9BACT|nr:hypothetical protein [Spirosoma endbachense]QHV98694.1 hypothetical protein GJR95_28435 [Spirosoma endbachense]